MLTLPLFQPYVLICLNLDIACVNQELLAEHFKLFPAVEMTGDAAAELMETPYVSHIVRSSHILNICCCSVVPI